MSKKQTNKPEIQAIETTIDMRLTKNDILEMLIQEQRDRLELELKNAHEKRKQTVQQVCDAAIAHYGKNFATEIETIRTSLSKLHNRCVVFSLEANSYCITISFHDTEGRNLNNVELPHSKSVQAELETSKSICDGAKTAIYDFDRDIKKSKTALTRQLLEKTPEGKAILANISLTKIQFLPAK